MTSQNSSLSRKPFKPARIYGEMQSISDLMEFLFTKLEELSFRLRRENDIFKRTRKSGNYQSVFVWHGISTLMELDLKWNSNEMILTLAAWYFSKKTYSLELGPQSRTSSDALLSVLGRRCLWRLLKYFTGIIVQDDGGKSANNYENV